ncbi:MAG: cysteine rich repeat-containing protein [Woeseiaceae bacterium]
MKLKVAAISAGLLIGSSAFAQDNLVDYLVESCQTELETICGDVQVGEGRVLACLDANADQVGESCKKAIADNVGDE